MHPVGPLALWLAALLLTGAPSAAASSALHSPGLQPCSSAAPCGYIRPSLELVFPDLGACFAGPDCESLPAPSEEVRLGGLVRWTWDVGRDGAYPADPAQPIVITFAGGQRNPAWLDQEVDPPEYRIEAAQLADPAYLQPGGDSANPTVVYVYERPINVTLRRAPEGGPAPGQGVDYLLKAQSTASGGYFTAAYAVKVIGFAKEGTEPMPGLERAASSPSLAAVGVAALVGAALRTRRRES